MGLGWTDGNVARWTRGISPSAGSLGLVSGITPRERRHSKSQGEEGSREKSERLRI